jgi:hypothetical protein
MNNARKDNLPLHRTLHYRKIRRLVSLLCKAEELNKEDYDLFNMRAYSCYGDTLNGKNVIYEVAAGTNCSPFVGDNLYDVIEIPAKENKEPYTGDYLLLVQNKDFDYWMFLEMYHKFDIYTTRATNRIHESVRMIPQGKYSISFDKNSVITVSKEERGFNCNFGGNRFRSEFFDQMNKRKQAYGLSAVDILNKICKREKNIPGSFVDNRAVKIYKKKSISKKQNNKSDKR